MMRFTLLIVFLLAISAFGQTGSSSTSQTESKLYQGEEYFPYLFEPYRLNKIKTQLGFSVSTNIIEQSDSWQEEFKIHLVSLGEFEVGMKIISDIDLTTGLLRKQRFEMGEDWGEAVFTDNQIMLSQKSEDKFETFKYELKEKVYPCYFSTTFFSYLPLNGNFSGSFICFLPDFANVKKSFLTKVEVREMGSESVPTKYGMRDSYVVLASGVKTRDISDSKNSKKKPEKNGSDLPNLAKKFNSTFWIDKKTHELYFRD